MTANRPVLLARFDRDRCRHIAGGNTIVLHCHHFASLITQLANDCSLLDAKKLLSDCAEDAFYSVLSEYYETNGIIGCGKRIEIAERYFAEAGLGKLTVRYAGPYAGEIELKNSHVDEGWLKKWGPNSKPVNHIGCGYATAMFSAIFDRPKRSFAAKERQSIACGASVGVITVTDAVDVELGGI